MPHSLCHFFFFWWWFPCETQWFDKKSIRHWAHTTLYYIHYYCKCTSFFCTCEEINDEMERYNLRWHLTRNIRRFSDDMLIFELNLKFTVILNNNMDTPRIYPLKSSTEPVFVVTWITFSLFISKYHLFILCAFVYFL